MGAYEYFIPRARVNENDVVDVEVLVEVVGQGDI